MKPLFFDFARDKKGVSLIELLVAMTLIILLSLSLVSVAKYGVLVRKTAEISIMEDSFNNIKNYLHHSGCLSFKNAIFINGEASIKEVGFYKNAGHKSFQHYPEDQIILNKKYGIYIKSMTLTEPSSNGHSLFTVEFVYDGTYIASKSIKLELFRGGDNELTCTGNFCPAEVFVPDLSNRPCPTVITNANHQKVGEDFKKDSNSSLEGITFDISFFEKLANLDIEKFAFIIPKTESGKVTRQIIETKKRDTSCTCIGLFSCYKGYLSPVYKCFERDISDESGTDKTGGTGGPGEPEGTGGSS